MTWEQTGEAAAVAKEIRDTQYQKFHQENLMKNATATAAKLGEEAASDFPVDPESTLAEIYWDGADLPLQFVGSGAVSNPENSDAAVLERYNAHLARAK